MRVLGVVAEYDPFHRGHALHLSRAREAAGADRVIVVMSCCFTQRGDASLLPPAARVCAALRNGADAVIALPVLWSVRDAEHFALGGISLLRDLGADAVSFGAECADAELLRRAADILETQDNTYRTALRRHISAGQPYPAAVSAALEECLPGGGKAASAPNNTLGICYLRAMRRLEWDGEVYPILRNGDYHDPAVNRIPSATAVRQAILRGSWHQAIDGIPDNCRELQTRLARDGQLHRPDMLDTALLARLRTMTGEEYAALPNLSEGIEDRLRQTAAIALSRQELVAGTASARYPRARVNRLCTHALLGLTERDTEEYPLPPAAILLGIRDDAKPLLSRLGSGRIPLLGRAGEYPAGERWMELERNAWALWPLGAGMPGDLLFRQGVQHV